MLVYKITNKINKKIYVGQTIKPIEKRFQEHVRVAFSDSTTLKRAIHYAIQKYGKENFTIEQIDSANSLDELNTLEEYWIQKLNSMAPYGYNLNSGGRNRIPSDKTRELMSKQNRKSYRGYGVSEYKGVKYNKKLKAYYVEIRILKRRKFLGLYENEIDAAKAYDFGIVTFLNGEGYLNFPDEIDPKAFEKKRMRTITLENQRKMQKALALKKLHKQRLCSR